MSDNMKCSYPVILSLSNQTKMSAQLYCLLQDMDNVQNAINPLSGRTTQCADEKVSKVQQVYPDTVSSSLQ